MGKLRLEVSLSSLSQSARDDQQQHAQWREEQLIWMRQLEGDSLQKLSQLSRESQDLRREKNVCENELLEKSRESDLLKSRLNAAESDLLNLRELFQKSQATVRYLTQESVREGQFAKEKSASVADATAALESARSKESSLVKQLAQVTETSREEKAAFEQRLDDVMKSSEKLVVEKDERMQRLRTEYESRIQALSARHSREMDQERAKLQTLLRDSQHFLEVVLEPPKHGASSSQALHTAAVGHAQLLQQLGHSVPLRAASGVSLASPTFGHTSSLIPSVATALALDASRAPAEPVAAQSPSPLMASPEQPRSYSASASSSGAPTSMPPLPAVGGAEAAVANSADLVRAVH